MKLIVFDFDGTLVDSRKLIIESHRIVFGEFGLALPSEDDSLSLIGMSLELVLAQLAGPGAPVEKMVAAYRRLLPLLRADVALAETPTLQELGAPGFPTEVIFGLLAPAGTPVTIVGRLNGAINDALRSAEVRASLDAIGVEARIGTPREFSEVLDQQARQWKTLIDEIGIRME